MLTGLSGKIERTALMATKQALRGIRRCSPELHVFIAGVQRSGTNMVMDVLERSLDTDVYHETDTRAFDNYQMRDVAVIHSLAHASKARYFIIKALCELEQIPSLMDGFTPAKTIWIVRDYRHAVASALRSFKNFAKQVKRIASNTDSGDWRSRGMSESTRQLVGSTHHDNMNDASAAALIWYFRNLLFFERGLDRDPRVRLVRYEALVTEPVKQFREIFDFLELSYSTWTTRKIFASSAVGGDAVDIEQSVCDLCERLTERFELIHEQRGS
ncbi:MAG: sulfotransferase family protein [Burkholderiales bacterium]